MLVKMLQDKYPFKTNEWIEEDSEIPVISPVVNEKEKRVEFVHTTQKVKQKTYYADSKPIQVVCKDHVYICLDKHKYLFKCTKCDWHRILSPITHKYDPVTGFVTYRESGQRL